MKAKLLRFLIFVYFCITLGDPFIKKGWLESN